MIRLAVRCRPEAADRVLAELVELVPDGVEEERGEGWVEYAIYGPPGELPSLPDLEASTGEGLVAISSTEVPDDWADSWRDFHRPVAIGHGRLVVRPSWLDTEAERGGGEAAPIEVVVDPGQAFGTGAHATTGLCLELLLELADAGEADGPLADLGTGSGVLAIAAAKLGWQPIVACDSEAAAVEAAGANARRNGVAIEVERVDLRRDPAPTAPTVVANLTGLLLEEVARRLLEPPRRMICSGLFATEAVAVARSFGARGLTVVEQRDRGEWAALLLRT